MVVPAIAHVITFIRQTKSQLALLPGNQNMQERRLSHKGRLTGCYKTLTLETPSYIVLR